MVLKTEPFEHGENLRFGVHDYIFVCLLLCANGRRRAHVGCLVALFQPNTHTECTLLIYLTESSSHVIIIIVVVLDVPIEYTKVIVSLSLSLFLFVRARVCRSCIKYWGKKGHKEKEEKQRKLNVIQCFDCVCHSCVIKGPNMHKHHRKIIAQTKMLYIYSLIWTLNIHISFCLVPCTLLCR